MYLLQPCYVSGSKDAWVKAAIGLVLQGERMETFSQSGTYTNWYCTNHEGCWTSRKRHNIPRAASIDLLIAIGRFGCSHLWGEFNPWLSQMGFKKLLIPKWTPDPWWMLSPTLCFSPFLYPTPSRGENQEFLPFCLCMQKGRQILRSPSWRNTVFPFTPIFLLPLFFPYH